MKQISEILQRFTSQSGNRTKIINSFIDSVFLLSGIKIKPEQIVYEKKQIILTRDVPSVLKNLILLKKEKIILEIKTKNPNSTLVEIK